MFYIKFLDLINKNALLVRPIIFCLLQNFELSHQISHFCWISAFCAILKNLMIRDTFGHMTDDTVSDWLASCLHVAEFGSCMFVIEEVLLMCKICNRTINLIRRLMIAIHLVKVPFLKYSKPKIWHWSSCCALMADHGSKLQTASDSSIYCKRRLGCKPCLVLSFVNELF